MKERNWLSAIHPCRWARIDAANGSKFMPSALQTSHILYGLIFKTEFGVFALWTDGQALADEKWQGNPYFFILEGFLKPLRPLSKLLIVHIQGFKAIERVKKLQTRALSKN